MSAKPADPASEVPGPVRVGRSVLVPSAPVRSVPAPSVPAPSAPVPRVLAPSGSELVSLIGQRVRVEVLSYGAHLVGVWWPDSSGVMDNTVVSLRRPDGTVDTDAYRDRSRNPYLGATVGRCANRIAGARFDLDGVTHRLVPNEGGNQLHGGPDGFDRREWQVSTHADEAGAQVSLRLISGEGDQGYPGRVGVTVTYRLDAAGVLRIDVEGTTDAPTVLNVTNHAYWNLAGSSGERAPASASIQDHMLSVAADRVVGVDDALLPTGELDPVDGTPWDLRSQRRLGGVVDQPELAGPGGLDHCLVLRQVSTSDGRDFTPHATLVDPTSGRRLRMRTDQPGLQVYTANQGAGPLPRHGAVCLESQHLPDSPNQPGFPSATLHPGQIYRHRQVLVLDTVG